jgi:hypothetical protein
MARSRRSFLKVGAPRPIIRAVECALTLRTLSGILRLERPARHAGASRRRMPDRVVLN